MKFTFGIITTGDSEDNLNLIVDSIEQLNIPEYQVLIVGNSNICRMNTLIISFDESIKSGWITKKKNLITQNAAYENIIYSHDYILYEKDWYEGFLQYEDDFKICMNRIINPDKSRYRDWVIWPHNDNFMDDIVIPKRHCLIPYNMTHLSKYMYISGAYWVAKKEVMLEFPLDENLCWGEGEDVAWSKQVREKYTFSMNPYSTVRTLKFKDPAFEIADKKTVEILNTIDLSRNSVDKISSKSYLPSVALDFQQFITKLINKIFNEF